MFLIKDKYLLNKSDASDLVKIEKLLNAKQSETLLTSNRYHKIYASLKDKGALFSIYEKEEYKNRWVGFIYLSDFNWISRSVNLFFCFNEEFSVNDICKLIFDEFNLHKISCYISATNKDAIKACIKAGFIQEGCKCRELFYAGHYFDINIYGKINENI